MPANTIFNGDVIGTSSVASVVIPSGLPTGIVSASTQINTGSFTGSFTGDGSGLLNVQPPTTYGSVGTYILATTLVNGQTTASAGTVVSGSALSFYSSSNSDQYVGANVLYQSSQANANTRFDGTGTNTVSLGLGGSWRLMTNIINSTGNQRTIPGFFVRIS